MGGEHIGSGRRFTTAAIAIAGTLALAGAPAAFGEPAPKTIAGTAQVLDADTLIVNEEQVRLYGISAPRITDWPWGPFARAALDSFAHGKEVNCLVVGTDPNRRPVARCILPGDDLVGKKTLGETMIRAGWATHHRLATHGSAPAEMTTRYDDAEEDARTRKVGIWGLR